MQRKPPTAADVTPPTHTLRYAASRAPAAALTPAQSHALRRSAPLTPEQFKSLRHLAEQGVSPLRHF